MKICNKPWSSVYVVDAENGQVWPCAWLNMRGKEFCLGNLLEQDLEDIFKSYKAEEFRKSILDGSYHYCSINECCDLSNDTLPDLTDEELSELFKQKLPTEFILAYEETCNHACSSCRNEYFKGTKEYYDKVSLICDKLLPYLNRAKYIDVNGRGEFFASENLLRLIERLRPERKDFTLEIETNAALFDEEHFQRIAHLSRYNIRIAATVNSFQDSTYRYLNGYSNHVDKVIDNLRYIRSLREKGIINHIEMAMVVQESNFREIPSWVKRCLEEFGADNIRIRGIMQFSMDENDFWFKDVFNPLHPFYREAIDILHDPVLKDDRVWFWEGDYEKSRKPLELPVKRFENNYNILYRLTELADDGQLDNVLSAYKDKRVGLYGAGKISQYLIKHCTKKFETVYDSNKGNYDINGIMVKQLSEGKRIEDIDVLIITVPFFKEQVLELLQNIGFCGEIVLLDQLLVR